MIRGCFAVVLAASLFALSHASIHGGAAIADQRKLHTGADRISPALGIVLAQAEVRIPSDAQLERMEERAITTPPLDVSGAPRRARSEKDEIRQMDERDRRIDEQLMGRGAICADCK